MRTLLLLSYLLTTMTAAAQDHAEQRTLLQKFDQYKASKVQGELFVHIDKNIYLPEERIWFSAYLFKVPQHLLNKTEYIELALVDPNLKKIVLRSQFSVKNGLSSGELGIPDSISPGNYELLAMGNVVDQANNPVHRFNQNIVIGSNGVNKPSAEPAVTVTEGLKNADLSVKFYPEGGYLLKGSSGLIAYETLRNGHPTELTATLLDNGMPIEELKTSRNGVGKFRLNQLSGRSYALKIKLPNSLRDTLVQIPELSMGIAALEIRKAVTGDSLRLRLSSVLADTLQVVVHNYNDVFSAFPILTNQLGREIKIALEGVPRGIAAITVLDPKGLPLTERLFFAHFGDQVQTIVKSDKAVYNSNEPIRIELALKDKNNRPLQGLFSTAVVHSTRLDFSALQDIESYIFLKSTLNSYPSHPSGRAIEDEDFVEELLLTKGWRNYTWQELQKANSNTPLTLKALAIEGRVLKKGKVLKEPAQLLFSSNGNFRTLQTDSTGRFVAPTSLLMNDGESGVTISIANGNKQDYQIQLYDSLGMALENFISQHPIQQEPRLPALDNPLSTILKTQGSITLESVTIKGNGRGMSKQPGKIPGANPCGDYVDEFGYLNYPKSAGQPGLYQPVAGRQYKRRIDKDDNGHQFVVEAVTYAGCEDKKNVYARFPGIRMEKRFYGPDPSAKDQQQQTTLFWRAQHLTDQSGRAVLDFFSGQLKGNFKVTVQGITEDNILYGTSEFDIR